MKIMRNSFFLYFSLLFICFIHQIITIEQRQVNFTDYPGQYVDINKKDTYIVDSYFTKKEGIYLYLYPIIPANNEGIVKIYFKGYSKDDKEANILDCEYYTLEVNSGLIIDSNKLNYQRANVFIVCYGNNNINIKIWFTAIDALHIYNYLSETRINQFLLPKTQTVQLDYYFDKVKPSAISFISKYSLRNFKIKVIKGEKEIPNSKISYAYPNGYSFFFDNSTSEGGTYIIEIENTNKINARDEIIIFGQTKYDRDNIFPNPIINGFQLYIERISSSLSYLKNLLSIPFYYNYQIYAKKVEFRYLDSKGKDIGKNINEEYNSMVCNSLSADKMAFDLPDVYVGMYIQFLDFNNLEMTQKNLQPLVSGLPKSLLVPAGKSLYHFLPVLKDSKLIHYYIRSKLHNSKIFVAFETCQTHPNNCYITEKLTSETSTPLIGNIGMWFTQNANSSSLQLIYVYCETECNYDILMSYDEDPLFMFPDNNYTKYLGESQRDIYVLPVFEYLSNYEELKIDLTVMSGKATIKLYESLENLMGNSPIYANPETIGERQTYTITKNTFSTANYYKKDLYALVEGDVGSFYNLMYTSISEGKRILDNNRVFNDIIKADSSEVKTYIFENKGNEFYISITTPTCKSKIIINNNEQSNNDNHYLYKATTKGKFNVSISLITDNGICQNGFEDQIMIYGYNSDNTDILIGENNYIYSSFIGSQINFKYFFNPNDQNGDNSYNLELERLSKTKISFEYKLERISFDKTQKENTQKDSLSQTLVSNKNNIITSSKILSICSNLNENEICGLTMSIIPSDKTTETNFTFYLNKNSKNYARILTKENTLINSVNSDKAQYYYIDLDKNYDTEIILNSYGNDLEVKYEINQDKTKSVIPFSNFENPKNYHQIHLSKNDYSTCVSFCRLYIGVHMPKTDNDISTTFSLNYFLVDESNTQKTDIILPLNYQSHYKFDNLEKITYTLWSYDKSNLVLELASESPNIEFTATVTNSGKTQELKSGGKLSFTDAEGEIKILIPNPGKNSIYKIKSSSIGKQLNSQIYPILSSFSEECSIVDKNSACYYLIDKTPDMSHNHFAFFVPESEDIHISIQELDLGFAEKPGSNINDYLSLTKEYTYTSKGKMHRPNWDEYTVDDKKSLLIRLGSFTGNKITANLLTSFTNKPNTITLNCGEKRIFTINKGDNNELNINIPKANGNKNKYKINLHTVKGNLAFIILDQTYNLGLQYNYKDDMTIIIDSDNVGSNLVLKASIMELNMIDIDKFIFSVEYIVESKDKLIYELENEKVNSFKFYKDSTLSNIHLYMKANSTIERDIKKYKEINMNIKIYTSNAEFDIKSYIVNEEIIEKCKSGLINAPEGNTIGNIKTFANSNKKENWGLTLAKLEIESKIFDKYVNDKTQLYIYLLLSPKEGSQTKNAKISIYPYDMKNTKPLATSELFIQKIPPKTVDYQFLLVKMDLYEKSNILVEYIPPNSKKYYYGSILSENKQNEIARSDEIIDRNSFNHRDVNQIALNVGSTLRYLLFDIYANKTNLESNEDLFLFKYRQFEKDIYFNGHLDFNATGYTNKIIFNFKAFEPSNSETGRSIIIIKGYEKSVVPTDTTSMSLIFGEKKSIFTHYIIGRKEGKEEVSVSLSGGEYTFACIEIIEDNEREEYVQMKPYSIKIETAQKDDPLNGMLDYIKNHVFATVVVGVVILLFLAIMINICRSERKHKGGIEIKVNDLGGEMLPK